jgi:hypothetical protein
MTHEQLRLVAAPELVVVNLVAACLTALRLALLAEHPLLADDLAAMEDPPVQHRARVVLRQADRLRRSLAAYRRKVDAALRTPDEPDPF